MKITEFEAFWFCAFIVAIFAAFALATCGCATDNPKPVPPTPIIGVDMIRPDGSVVPDPTYATNVTPWVWGGI